MTGKAYRHIYLERRRRADGVHLIARSKPPRMLLPKPVDLTDTEGCEDTPEGWRLAHRWAQATYERLRGVSHTGPATVGELLDQIRNDPDLRPATRKGYGTVARRIEAALGRDFVVGHINQGVIDRLLPVVAPEHLERSTRRTYTVTLGAILQRWHDARRLPLVPPEALGPKSLRRPGYQHTDPEWLTPAQIAIVLEAARELGAYAGRGDVEALVRWLLLTGMRKAAAIGTVGGDYNPATRTVKVDASRAKNKRTRHVKLRICPTVEDWIVQRNAGADERLFAGWTDSSVGHLFVALRERSGIRHLKPKTLRSTCASYIHNAPGLPLTDMQAAVDQLGHTPEVVRVSYYGAVPEGLVDPRATTLEEAMGILPVANTQAKVRRMAQ